MTPSCMILCRWHADQCGLDHPCSSRPSPNPLQYCYTRSYTLQRDIRHIPDLCSQMEHYRRRVRARDPCCLISGLPVVRGDYSRFKVAHIFPRGHEIQVSNYSSVRSVLTLYHSGSIEASQVVSQILHLLQKLEGPRKSTLSRMYCCCVAICMMHGTATNLVSILMFVMFFAHLLPTFSQQVTTAWLCRHPLRCGL